MTWFDCKEKATARTFHLPTLAKAKRLSRGHPVRNLNSSQNKIRLAFFFVESVILTA